MYWIRKRVGEITAARRARDVQTKAISRQATFATGPRVKVRTPRRQHTEVDVRTLEEFLQLKLSSSIQEDSKYSQQPSVSSLCPVVADANRVSGSILAIIH